MEVADPVTDATDTVRSVVDQTLDPRREKARTVLGMTGDPIPLGRSDLLYLWDEYGTEYLDLAALGAPVGHRHPAVMAAITEQLRYYSSGPGRRGDFLLRWPVEYAAALAETVGPDRQVLFTEGEREAVRYACRTAREYSRRPGVAVVGGDYGWLDGATPIRSGATPSLVSSLVSNYHIGAVLVSLVDPAGDFLDPAWVQEVSTAASQAGAPVIIDESVTGFGRTGSFWAHQAVDLHPDMVVCGGPIGGGLPLGAVIGPSLATDVSSSQAGNPISCAAGNATLKAVHVGVLEHVKSTAVVFDEALTEVVAQFPTYLSATAGVGLLRTLTFVSGKMASRFAQDIRAVGAYVAPPVGNRVWLAPPLITSDNELRRAVDLIASVLIDWG